MEVFGHIGECRLGSYAGGLAGDHVSSLPSQSGGVGGGGGGFASPPSAKAAFMAREPDDIASVMSSGDMHTCVIEGDINTTQVTTPIISVYM